jgi:RNA polymerase sigma factor (sigma-70 family)
MATTPMDEVIQQLRRAVLRDEEQLTDGQLLDGYLSRRDEAALAALVRRHAGMVWGVCRRLLQNQQDAEDAFQATFLVLVRKATSIVPRGMVGNWLYGVANQTALKARASVAKRRGREKQVATIPEPAATETDVWRDLQPLLDEELSRLPDKLRAVVVLCDLEGKTRKDAARQLGCPEGTVAGRLARARVKLAKRLARHGLPVSGGALAGMLSQQAAACVPPAVVSSTIEAAGGLASGHAPATGAISVLMEGVLKDMLLRKLKTVLMLFLVAALTGTAGLVYQSQAQGQPQASTPPKRASNGPSGVIKLGQGPANYKAIFVKTLAVMAEHFETIEYADQFAGRIDARGYVGARSVPAFLGKPQS